MFILDCLNYLYVGATMEFETCFKRLSYNNCDREFKLIVLVHCWPVQLYLTPPRYEDCTCNGLDWVMYLCWVEVGFRLSLVRCRFGLC